MAEGDDLIAIGERFEIPVDELKAHNQLGSNEIEVGQKLVVGAGAPGSAAAPTRSRERRRRRVGRVAGGGR